MLAWLRQYSWVGALVVSALLYVFVRRGPRFEPWENEKDEEP